ncbi:MAG: hypothetical protein LBK94_09365 [Prevotellaceae bacterium]|jgi:hypothetical protein|nr:hypothetical protein [Prevotellaceae bacterium]
MELNRIPTIQEERLLELLIKKSSLLIPKDWKNGLLVRNMDDGAMGSLYLFPQGKIFENRMFGKQVSEFQFTDIDGIEVIASLNVDSDGNLFELDIWKTDFGKLIKFPDL